MKRSLSRAAIGAAVLAGTAMSAGAADLYGGYGGMKDGGYRPALSHPSWYVRLDGAYAVHDAPRMVRSGIDEFTHTGFDDTWTIGGGIGRYLSQSLRIDVTMDYRFETDAHGRNVTNAVLPGTHRFGVDSTVLLANVYYDFARGSLFNPYIGAGLGTAYHSTFAGTTQTGGVIAEGSGNWHAAGALMGGFTMAVHDRLSFDAGYRFLYLGETKAGGVSGLGVTPERGPTVEDMHAHEFRFGLRWDIH